MTDSAIIVEYFAKRAHDALPNRKMREQSAQDLKALYAVLKVRTEQRTLSDASRAVYGVTRLAGTLTVMNEVLDIFLHKGLLPPQTILDCGTGPGTALFAAYAHFGKAVRYTGIEKDHGFIEMAERAVHDLLPDAANSFRFIDGKAPVAQFSEMFDLTMFSYMLSEMPPTKLEPLLQWALARTKGYLVITDAGTPNVYRQLMAARQYIIEQGFTVVAPCPHQSACPLAAPNFCHFPARFTRHAEARRLKGATASAEDEKYCYLIAAAPSRKPDAPSADRVIARPLKRSGHCILDVCARDGKKLRLTITKKHEARYRQARDASWGDEF